MTKRIKLLQEQLQEGQAILLSKPTDVRYFARFQTLVPEEREAFLLVTRTKAYLLHGLFCPIPQSILSDDLIAVVASYPEQLAQQLREVSHKLQLKEILIDSTTLFVNEYQALQKQLTIKISNYDPSMVFEIRARKDKAEIDQIRQSCQVATRALATITPQIETGMTELEVEHLLEQTMTQLGSEQPAFPTIVAFGEHTALPHHQPTNRKLQENTAVLIDFGASIDGYRSDMTRSWWFGNQPDTKYTQLAETVQQAYHQALNKLSLALAASKPFTAQQLDQTARQVITEAGFGTYFIHTTGHGLGLDIHEQPSLSSRNTTPLQPDMVVTIEPGIYLENQFGYRYENTIWLSAEGAQELTVL